MRILGLLSVVLLIMGGCAREDGAAVPDRGGHAFVMAGAAGGGSSTPLVSRSQRPEAGETTIAYQPGDRLYRLAEQHGVSLEWLIRRNDLVDHPPRVGQQLIVPR